MNTKLVSAIIISALFIVPVRSLEPPSSDYLPLTFTEEEKSFIKNSGEIRVGFRDSGKPVIYKEDDGVLAGIVPSFIDLISSKTGLTFKTSLMNIDSDVTGSLRDKDYDAIVTFTGEGNSFGKNVSVTMPILSTAMVLVINDKTSYSSSAELTYCFKKGFETAGNFVHKINPESTVIYINKNDIESCLLNIKEKKADATFLNSYTASYLLQKPQYSSFRVLSQIYFTQYLRIALEQNTYPLLLSILNKTIKSLSAGEIQNIALANTAGIRYKKTAVDTIYENRIPIILLFFLFCSVFFAFLSMNIIRTRYTRKIIDSNKKLEKANADLSFLNQSKTELLSRVSHEIRTPVNAIAGLSYLGQKSTKEEQSAEYFKKIESSGKYLAGLINDILDMNKIDGGSIKLVNMPASIPQILDDIKTIISPLADTKQINFIINNNGTEKCAIFDKMRFEQILINLLMNAIKFTSSKGTVTLNFIQTREDDKIHAKASVTDTGCGISADFLPKLFQPFSQENRNPSLYGTGTGLGLAISRRLARLMGGDITVQSTEGKGSTFTVTAVFDACGEIADPETETAQLHQNDDRVLKGKRILLAEDNEINIEVALGLLKRKGLIITTAADGQIAVDTFAQSQENDFDLILMDIRMPHLNGFEASQAIRKLHRKDAKTVPIIAMTADAFSDSMQQALEYGMNDYITKPIEVEKMYSCLRTYLS